MTTEQKKVITSFTTTEKMLGRLQELKETQDALKTLKEKIAEIVKSLEDLIE